MDTTGGARIARRFLADRARVGTIIDRTLVGLAIAAFVGALIWTVALNGVDPRGWEWFVVSGVALLLVCLLANLGQEDRVFGVLRRLVRQGVVRSAEPEDAVDAVAAQMLRRWPYTAGVTFAAFVVLMALLWFLAFGRWPFGNGGFWVELVLAGIAGVAVGRMIAFGGLGSAIRRAKLDVTPIPGHVDGAAGLRSIGWLYLRQATIVAALTIYAGFWWLMFPTYADGAYAHWSDPYLLLMLIGIVAEVLVCVLPLWAFHRIMVAEKAGNAQAADQQAVKIDRLRAARRTGDQAEQERIDAEIAALSVAWNDIETMPVWPLDVRVRRRLTVNNLLVLLPLALNAIAPGGWGQDVLEAFQGLASG